MAAEGAMMYAIRLPSGRWWRRGTGTRPGGPTGRIALATQYRAKSGAVTAAVMADLDTKHGGYEIVEMPRVVGATVVRSEP